MAPMIRSPTLIPARAMLCHSCRSLGLSLALSASVKSTSSSSSRLVSPLHSQRRWIGQKYLQKKKDAEKAWEAQAEEIEAGTTKHLFDELEDRGFIKDIVG